MREGKGREERERERSEGGGMKEYEEGGERWSKPHVSTLTLHSLFELRTCLQTGSILLDLDGYSLPQIVGESGSVAPPSASVHRNQKEPSGTARTKRERPHGLRPSLSENR